MENELNQAHKTKKIYQTFLRIKLVVLYKQHTYHEEISEKTTITCSDDSDNSY